MSGESGSPNSDSGHDTRAGYTQTVRSNPRARISALGFGIVIGAILGSIHWAGIFAGGAIAGLGQRSILRGICAGAVSGLGVWLVFLATLRLDAAMVPALGSMPIIALSFGIAVGYGLLGGLLRGVI